MSFIQVWKGKKDSGFKELSFGLILRTRGKNLIKYVQTNADNLPIINVLLLQQRIKEKVEEERQKMLEKRQQFKEQNKQKLVFDPVEMERKERARSKKVFCCTVAAL